MTRWWLWCLNGHLWCLERCQRITKGNERSENIVSENEDSNLSENNLDNLLASARTRTRIDDIPQRNTVGTVEPITIQPQASNSNHPFIISDNYQTRTTISKDHNTQLSFNHSKSESNEGAKVIDSSTAKTIKVHLPPIQTVSKINDGRPEIDIIISDKLSSLCKVENRDAAGVTPALPGVNNAIDPIVTKHRDYDRTKPSSSKTTKVLYGRNRGKKKNRRECKVLATTSPRKTNHSAQIKKNRYLLISRASELKPKASEFLITCTPSFNPRNTGIVGKILGIASHHNLDYRCRIVPVVDKDKRIETLLMSNVKFNEHYRIVRIEKILNPFLYAHYRLRVEQAGEEAEEILLYHGTSQENLDGIVNDNFDWRYTERGKYGRGVYFANNPWFASHYSKENDEGTMVMIVARVLVGHYHLGKYSIQIPREGYDTTISPDNQVYTKYDDNTFYPEWIFYYEPIY